MAEAAEQSNSTHGLKSQQISTIHSRWPSPNVNSVHQSTTAADQLGFKDRSPRGVAKPCWHWRGTTGFNGITPGMTTAH